MKTKLILLVSLWPVALAAQTGTIFVDEDHTNHKITNLTEILFSNLAAPSTPASGKTHVYVDSTSKNIAAKNDAGVVNHGIRSVADASTQYVHGIDDDGTVHFSNFSGGGGGAPSNDHYVTTRNDTADLPNSVSLGALTTGILKVTVASSIATPSTVAAPTGAIVGDSDTQTLTNKRITARITTITSSATPTINTDNTDAVTITALAVAITSMTTNLSGTPNNFDKLIIRFKDDGTGRAITWGASFASSQSTLPTTTVASKVLTVGLIYDSVKAKWVCLAVDQEP